MEFFERLSARRKEIGMSLDTLVEQSGIPKGTVTKILTGVTPNPGIETLKAITYALGLSLDDLAGNAERPAESGGPSDESRFMELYSCLDAEGRDLFDYYLDLPRERRHLLVLVAQAFQAGTAPPPVPPRSAP